MAIVWLDLRVNDLERAQEFYRKLLGWEFEQFDEGAATVREEGELIGKMSETPGREEGPGNTGAVIYLEVKDLDAAMQMATSMGARIEFGPESDGSGGTFVDIVDPFGLRIGLIKEESRLT